MAHRILIYGVTGSGKSIGFGRVRARIDAWERAGRPMVRLRSPADTRRWLDGV